MLLQLLLSLLWAALNHTPDILIPGNLESGCPMDLTCSVPWACERGTPLLFSWMSATHPSLVPKTHNSSVLTLTPQPQDHGASLTCEVTLPGARVTTRTIHLNVSWSMAVVVLVAIVEAVVKILLLLLSLIILMYHFRKVARPTEGMEKASTVSS
ncbi:sialic acid binding Ig like lectin 7 [Phyllostomus discolor]|uniref:Sialic acid binding Ig like lectin 7 n=1 Tax=Phyllostomus discolor TaxID=89673 RepID=A0A833YPH3_9CHIR|nr:sialic acid binding Ig like lectin 7 [Phyllostomus discolor]